MFSDSDESKIINGNFNFQPNPKTQDLKVQDPNGNPNPKISGAPMKLIIKSVDLSHIQLFKSNSTSKPLRIHLEISNSTIIGTISDLNTFFNSLPNLGKGMTISGYVIKFLFIVLFMHGSRLAAHAA
ncbi:MAG: hypothetical protein AAFY76_21000 [Cyanobacteria bacterium J06649_11]